MSRALAIAIGVALLVPGLALGRPRVAILPLDGDRGTLLDVIAEVLEEDYAVASGRQVIRAIDDLAIDPTDMTNKQLKKLSRQLDVEVVIRGDVAARGAHKVMHLLLFVGGKKVRGFRIEFASARSRRFKEALRDKLYERLGAATTRARTPDAVVETDVDVAEPGSDDAPAERGPRDRAPDAGGGRIDAGEGRDRDDPADGEERRGGREEREDRVAASGEDDEDPIGGGGERTSSASDADELGGAAGAASASLRGAGRAAIRVDLGPSFSSRSLTFSSRPYEEAPKPYKNGMVPGGRLRVELYPAAFSKPDSVLAGLGLGVELDQAVGLNLQTSVQPGTKFPVTQRAFTAGARFRILLGGRPTSPSLTLAAGYMTRMFQVDRSALVDNNSIDLPDVGYAGLLGGLDARIPVARSVAVVAGGRGIFVTTTGAIQRQTEYGQAKVTGGEGYLGLDVSIGSRIALRAVGELTQMGFAFTGTGQLSNNRDGDPTTKDVGGAADRYLGGALTLGVLY